MKRTLLSILSILFFLVACSSEKPGFSTQPTTLEESQPEPLFQYHDFTGEPVTFEKELYVTNEFVYGRKSNGFFADNLTEPNSFDQDGYYIPKLQNDSAYQWRRYAGNRNFENFRINTALSQVLVDQKHMGGAPKSQKLYLQDVVLTGLLQICDRDQQTGSIYALNHHKGDLLFYPYPDSLGDFPLIEVEAFWSPYRIRSTRSGYTAVADTVRLQLGNLDAGKLQFSFTSLLDCETVSTFFSDSDLVVAEVHLSELVLEYNYDAPVESYAILEDIQVDRRL